MTAEPTTAHRSRRPVPPQDGYTVDDLSTLKVYALTGIHHDRLKTDVPFTIGLDISWTALDAL